MKEVNHFLPLTLEEFSDMVKRIAVILFLCLVGNIEAKANNQYFTPDYQPAQSYYTAAPFNTQYCGPSACAYVLPPQNLAPSQVNPVYTNYPEVQRYWEVQPVAPSLPRYSTNNSPMENYEIYKEYKVKTYGSQYAPPTIQAPTVYPIDNGNNGAPPSNIELYKSMTKGITRQAPSQQSPVQAYRPTADYNNNSGNAPLSNYEIYKKMRR